MAHRLITSGELVLHGPIGFVVDGEGFLSVEIIEALAEMEGDITVRINSPGGIAADGIAVYNALRAHDGRVTTIIDGQALSAGAIVAMGGDKRLIGLGGVMMLHNASGRTEGPASAHAKSIEVLNVFDDSQARIFAKATGKTVAAMKKLLAEETWLTADDAIKEGFATGRISTPAKEPSAFDYGVYSRAPERLVAMAAARGWSSAAASAAATKAKAQMLAKWDRWLSSHPHAARRLVDSYEAGTNQAVFSELWDQALAGGDVITDQAGGTAAGTIAEVAREVYARRFAARDRKLH